MWTLPEAKKNLRKKFGKHFSLKKFSLNRRSRYGILKRPDNKNLTFSHLRVFSSDFIIKLCLRHYLSFRYYLYVFQAFASKTEDVTTTVCRQGALRENVIVNLDMSYNRMGGHV